MEGVAKKFYQKMTTREESEKTEEIRGSVQKVQCPDGRHSGKRQLTR